MKRIKKWFLRILSVHLIAFVFIVMSVVFYVIVFGQRPMAPYEAYGILLSSLVAAALIVCVFVRNSKKKLEPGGTGLF